MSSEYQEFERGRLLWDRIGYGNIPLVTHRGTFSASIEDKESPIAEQCKPLLVMDECKEVSPQDIEKITDYLRGRMELQSFIQTEKSDWLREYAKEQSHDHQ